MDCWKASSTLASFSSSSSWSILLFVASILLSTAPGVGGMRFTIPFFRAAAAKNTMATLPPGVVKYSQVPAIGKTPFTKTTIPKGLLKRHNTKDGTWGMIQVFHGQLQYEIDEGRHKGRYILNAQTPGVIEPQVHHSVSPISSGDDNDAQEDVSFVVEFYRHPGTGAVDEKREGLS